MLPVIFTYYSESALTAIKGKIPSRLSILVAISHSLILKKAVTAKPEYEAIFEMMHSSAFINAAKGTIFDDHTKSEGVCEYHNKLLNDNPCGYHQ